MTRPPSPDPNASAKLLGILLSGVFGQTRPDCSPESRAHLDQQPSGVHRVVLPEAEDEGRS